MKLIYFIAEDSIGISKTNIDLWSSDKQSLQGESIVLNKKCCLDLGFYNYLYADNKLVGVQILFNSNIDDHIVTILAKSSRYFSLKDNELKLLFDEETDYQIDDHSGFVDLFMFTNKEKTKVGFSFSIPSDGFYFFSFENQLNDGGIVVLR